MADHDEHMIHELRRIAQALERIASASGGVQVDPAQAAALTKETSALESKTQAVREALASAPKAP